jgi:hypothetical protein
MMNLEVIETARLEADDFNAEHCTPMAPYVAVALTRP